MVDILQLVIQLKDEFSHSSLCKTEASHVSCTRLAIRLVQLKVVTFLELSKPSIRPFEVCYVQKGCK